MRIIIRARVYKHERRIAMGGGGGGGGGGVSGGAQGGRGLHATELISRRLLHSSSVMDGRGADKKLGPLSMPKLSCTGVKIEYIYIYKKQGVRGTVHASVRSHSTFSEKVTPVILSCYLVVGDKIEFFGFFSQYSVVF